MDALHSFLDGVTPVLYLSAIAAIVVETVVLSVRKVPRDKRSRWLGIKAGILAFGFAHLVQVGVMFGVQMWLWEHRLFDLGVGPVGFVACFLVNDLMFYVSHRAMHEHRLLWAIHVVHHSPKHYDLTTGVRGSILGAVAAFPFYFWIPLIGIHPVLFVVCDTLFKFIGLGYHTEAVGKLGVLDEVLVTPANHRVHHAKNPAYLDKNYGGLLIVFDRLFGTFVRETEKPLYGIVKDWHGYGVVDCQVHELVDLWRDVRGANSWSDRLGYLVRAPGWKPTKARAERRSSSPGSYPEAAGGGERSAFAPPSAGGPAPLVERAR